MEKALGWSVNLVECPRKPAPKEVLMTWTREWAREGVKVDWEKLMPPKGFQVLPRRWVVERTFSWDRPKQKDEQRLRETHRDEPGVHLRSDESPDGEEIGPLVRLFSQFQKERSPKFGQRTRNLGRRVESTWRQLLRHAPERPPAGATRPPPATRRFVGLLLLGRLEASPRIPRRDQLGGAGLALLQGG